MSRWRTAALLSTHTVRAMGEPVYLLVDLPPGLTVDANLLGTSWPIPTAACPCSLVLPRPPLDILDEDRLPNAVEGGPLLAPSLPQLTQAADEWWTLSLESTDPDEAPSMWGWLYRGIDPEGNRIFEADVVRAVVIGEHEDPAVSPLPGGFVALLSDAADAWLVLLVAWLEVLGDTAFVPFKKITPRRGPVNRSSTLRTDRTNPKGVARVPNRPRRSLFTFTTPVALRPEQWTVASARADLAETPPLPHQLLRDARAARYGDDFRRAVIDAATACEIALAESIRSHLDSMPPAALDDLVNRRLNGLGTLHQFHVRGLAPIASITRKQLDDELASVRNRVAHSGYRPIAAEAAGAIAVAAALVNELDPLPAC